MKKFTPIIAISLLFCLFIYVFYRTEKTLVNQIIIALFSEEAYLNIKACVLSILPLKDFIIYSLPEGLWVFCITLTSGSFYIEVKQRRWHLVFAPICIAVFMEVLQLLHITNGRFDFMDIVFSAGFWILGLLLTSKHSSRESLQSLNFRTFCCIFSYSIVYLAHVTY